MSPDTVQKRKMPSAFSDSELSKFTGATLQHNSKLSKTIQSYDSTAILALLNCFEFE